jgi:hypothetical protein
MQSFAFANAEVRGRLHELAALIARLNRQDPTSQAHLIWACLWVCKNK